MPLGSEFGKLITGPEFPDLKGFTGKTESRAKQGRVHRGKLETLVPHAPATTHFLGPPPLKGGPAHSLGDTGKSSKDALPK